MIRALLLLMALEGIVLPSGVCAQHLNCLIEFLVRRS